MMGGASSACQSFWVYWLNHGQVRRDVMCGLNFHFPYGCFSCTYEVTSHSHSFSVSVEIFCPYFIRLSLLLMNCYNLLGWQMLPLVWDIKYKICKYFFLWNIKNILLSHVSGIFVTGNVCHGVDVEVRGQLCGTSLSFTWEPGIKLRSPC